MKYLHNPQFLDIFVGLGNITKYLYLMWNIAMLFQLWKMCEK